MKTASRLLHSSLLIMILVISACSPPGSSPDTQIQDTQVPGAEEGIFKISLAKLSWPEKDQNETCATELSAPVVELCIVNEGDTAASPNQAYVSLPSALAPGAAAAVLSTLPGGDWSPPIPVSLKGIPGFDSSAEGIFIINTSPGPDSSAEGIIIVNTKPGGDSDLFGIILVDSIPVALSALGIVLQNNEGIVLQNNEAIVLQNNEAIVLQNNEAIVLQNAEGIVLQNKEGAEALVGATTIQFSFELPEGSNWTADMGGSPPDLSTLAANLAQGNIKLSGELLGVLEFGALSDIHQMDEGIVWGGLVFGNSPESTQSPFFKPAEFSPPPDDGSSPPDDNLTGIVWGGMPEGAQGILVVDTLPTDGAAAQGIIIVEGQRYQPGDGHHHGGQTRRGWSSR